MTLTPGASLGPYKVTALLGVGGMGEVWRAHDARLRRDVALKILPTAVAADLDRLARFEREAHVLASLNHTNIAQIYGIEHADNVRALVLELVEGPTLAERIAQGPLPLDEALEIARQIADALDVAHEQGIVHRDLKPANIKVRPDGSVKVLDFGLAKALATETGGAGLRTGAAPDQNFTMSPTMTSPAMTQAGVILGTAAYMSPEQARGKPVDRRADIWAFGCVLYEMVTGRVLFSGETVTDTLAAIVTKEPDWTKVPARLKPILESCLQKDPRKRIRSVGDVWLLLDRPAAAFSTVPSWRRWIWPTAAALFFAAAVVVSFLHFTEARPTSAEQVRFQLQAPRDRVLIGDPVISPDGRQVAFFARGPNGPLRLWVQSLDGLAARDLAEASLADAFWSPDSRMLAFVSDGKLRKIAAAGGAPQTVIELARNVIRSGSWTRNGSIVTGIAAGQGLMRVPDGGGPPVAVTLLDGGRAEANHGYPMLLPDQRHFLYIRNSATRGNSGVFLGNLDAKPENQSPDPVLVTDSLVSYVPSMAYGIEARNRGYLLYRRDGSLIARPFNERTMKIDGEERVVGEAEGRSLISASETGVLAFVSNSSEAQGQPTWFDRSGTRLEEVGRRGEWGNVALSPDGTMFATSLGIGRNGHSMIIDLIRGVETRVAPGQQLDSSGSISSRGRVAFSVGLDLYLQDLNSAGEPELLFKSDIQKHQNHWSPDGRYLIYDEHHATRRQDLWVIDVAGDRTPKPFVTTNADESPAVFSPDGRWIAYASDETGKREIYVRDFAPDRNPVTGSFKITISTAGGDKPRWHPNGRELYYIAPDRKMMAVPIEPGPAFKPGTPVPLFATNVSNYLPYDVSRDGRFLINTIGETSGPSSMTIVLNWKSALKQ